MRAVEESYTPYFAAFCENAWRGQLHDAICQATNVFGNYKHTDMVYRTALPPFKF
jgi:hypothetical protein